MTLGGGGGGDEERQHNCPPCYSSAHTVRAHARAVASRIVSMYAHCARAAAAPKVAPNPRKEEEKEEMKKRDATLELETAGHFYFILIHDGFLIGQSH